MDQSQTKALAALQPFVHLVTATTRTTPTPSLVTEVIKEAISAPRTYVFTELLQTPLCQSLRGTDSQPWLTLLEIFSWGTYEEYKAMEGLPALDEAQTFKLRQLSLLSLASPFVPSSPTPTDSLTYASLLRSLSLDDPAQLETLVTQSIYSGLLTARLSPTSNPPVVNITSVAPLRDLRPQTLPALLQILQTWESRCTSTVSDLEAQISLIRTTAAQRSTTQRRRQDTVDEAVLNTKPPPAHENADGDRKGGGRSFRGIQRPPSKRDLDQQMEGEVDDGSDEEGRMDVDEGIAEMSHGGGGRGGHGVGSSRGAKRNRGRGSK